MQVQLPTLDDMADIAKGYGLNLELEDLQSFQGLFVGVLGS